MIISTLNIVKPNKDYAFDGSVELEIRSYTHTTNVVLSAKQASWLISQLEVFLREIDNETGEDNERNIPESNPATD